MELKTLSRRDPEFDAYLQGTFASDKRALPVRSLNVDSESEKVTFQLVPVHEIPLPPALRLWAQVFRLRNLVSVLFPLFLVLAKNVLDEIPWDADLAVLSILGALSLSMGAFLLNDYLDHVKGVDRVHPLSGSRAIQKGWVTADATRKWSWFYLILGGLLGAPAVFVFPELAAYLSLPAAVALLSWTFPKVGLKYRRFAEIVVFLLFGPFLTLGFQIAITGQFDLEALWIGVLAGWHFTFLVHLKNFESIMFNSQAGFTNTMSYLGFEKGRRFLELWWSGFIFLFAAYQWAYHSPEWFLILSLLLIASAAPFFLRLRRLTSPLGSQMARAIKLGRTAALLVFLVWALQCLWYWLVVELGTAT